MGYTGTEITKATGLSEEEAKGKLVKIMRTREDYIWKRREYDELGLAETYYDNSWGFITRVLGDDIGELTKLLTTK